jgi:hypothetical protein
MEKRGGKRRRNTSSSSSLPVFVVVQEGPQLTVDIWTHIGKFYDSKPYILLWTCHNSRVGLLRCFEYWKTRYPYLLDFFKNLRTQPRTEHFGPFCIYYEIEQKKKNWRWYNGVSARRITMKQSKIESLQYDVKVEKERFEKRSLLIDEYKNHFEDGKFIKVSKTVKTQLLRIKH